MAWQVETYLINQLINQGNVGAVIQLYRQGGEPGLIIYFTLDNSISPPKTNRPVPIVYMPYTAFPNMIEMLREEKPIWAQLWPSGLGYVGTGPEPVGEDEGP